MHRCLGALVVLAAACSFEPQVVGDDVELKKVEFVVDKSATDEGFDVGGLVHKVKVRLSSFAAADVRVTFELSGGTAALGNDFRDDSTTGGEVTIPAGELEASIPLRILFDNAEEPDEKFTLTLLSTDPTVAELGAQVTHEVTIGANALPQLQFVEASSTATEDNGERSLVLRFNVAPPLPVEVTYAVTGTAALTDDHGLASGTLMFDAGQMQRTLALPIVDDDSDEFDETVVVTLTTDANARVGEIGVHTHTIGDEDNEPTIGFAAGTSSTAEAGTANVNVTVSPPSGKPVTVDFALAGSGSATGGGTDFTFTAGTLTFPPGTASLPVPVTIAADALDENEETIALVLSNATNASLVGNNHTLTINDNDDTPSLSFNQATSSVNEGTSTQTVTATLSAVSGRNVQFSLNLGGNASSTNDFSVQGGNTNLTIPAGTPSLTFTVNVTNDGLDEDNETATFTLASLVNVVLGGTTLHTLTINDNDAEPTVRFDPATPNLDRNETDFGTDTFTYRVILSTASGRVVTVNVNVGGDATRGGGNSDYDFGEGDIPVTFQPGDTSEDIRVIVNGDVANENDNEVIMTLVDPDTAELVNGTGNTTRVHTILDDD